MTTETKEDVFRQFLRQKPFAPFVVEMLDGRRIVVKRPQVAINGNGAGFLSEDEGIVDIVFENISRIDHLVTEPKA